MNAWKPVVVGVDPSPESARAAALGWQIAKTAPSEYRLVHVVRDITADAAALTLPPNFHTMRQMLMDHARDAVETALSGAVPAALLPHLEVHIGRAATLLVELAQDAELLVLGGKHHSALGRWLVGSTVHQAARSTGVPLLVAGPSTDVPRRILAAVDLSDAARHTLSVAGRFAALFGADLRVLHVVEPIQTAITPFGAATPSVMLGDVLSQDEWLKVSSRTFEHAVWPLVTYPRAEQAIRSGPVAETVRAEAVSWSADLLVVGSHGKGWIDRLLIGGTTHRLLNDLPASLLVVPVRKLARQVEPAPVMAGAAAPA